MRLCDITDEMAAAKKAAIVERANELDCVVYFIDGMDKATPSISSSSVMSSIVSDSIEQTVLLLDGGNAADM